MEFTVTLINLIQFNVILLHLFPCFKLIVFISIEPLYPKPELPVGRFCSTVKSFQLATCSNRHDGYRKLQITSSQ
jgi:hypothetical protein